jgi:hypothetical protein
VELEKQKEEMRKKYDQYKKMFYNEKHEKESKIKELQVLKDDTPVIEIKELKAKYDILKQSQLKEYQTRKEKEAKLETAYAEHQKKVQ